MSLSGARCVGLWWLFDSLDERDYMEARELCADCPVVAECRQRLADERSLAGSPRGTWAGVLVGSKGRHREWTPPPHGTQAAYDRHRYRGELACGPCVAAHREYERERVGAA